MTTDTQLPALQPCRYRKLPIEITAVQWDGTEAGFHAVCAVMGIKSDPDDDRIMLVTDNNFKAIALAIPTLEGEMEVSPGDWVIQGIEGEFYPCKPSIFAATYEIATPTQPSPDAERIDAIEARANAATKGPWEYHCAISGNYKCTVRFSSGSVATVHALLGQRDNGEFIAHAREDIPWLCTTLRAALAEIGRLTNVNACMMNDVVQSGLAQEDAVRERDDLRAQLATVQGEQRERDAKIAARFMCNHVAAAIRQDRAATEVK